VSTRWRVRLTATAEADFAAILTWTAERFGSRQEERYEDILIEAVVSLENEAGSPNARPRDDLGAGVRVLHAGRQRRARHIVVFGLREEERVISALRILHEQMDLPAHVPSDDD
jgi:plasmid stabilization system protein ParE